MVPQLEQLSVRLALFSLPLPFVSLPLSHSPPFVSLPSFPSSLLSPSLSSFLISLLLSGAALSLFGIDAPAPSRFPGTLCGQEILVIENTLRRQRVRVIRLTPPTG